MSTVIWRIEKNLSVKKRKTDNPATMSYTKFFVLHKADDKYIGWQILKIFFSGTTGPMLTKLAQIILGSFPLCVLMLFSLFTHT